MPRAGAGNRAAWMAPLMAPLTCLTLCVIDQHAGPQGDGTSITPVGWRVTPVGQQATLGSLPTTSALSPDGSKLLVLNAVRHQRQGARRRAEPERPQPVHRCPAADDPPWLAQYVGTMMKGTLSTIPVPGPATLERYTRQMISNDGFGAGASVRPLARNPVPARVGESSPIKHVIYIIRENRTYDQEFGSLGKGNGDPALDLFGNESAPNSRTLESRFVTLDNFYADAEVSAQGWEWSVGANSDPYTEQTWVGNYSGRNHPYDYEGGNNAAAMNRDPLDSYIWDRLADAHVPFRNYGFYETDNVLNTGFNGADPRLAASTDPNYCGWDLRCPDSSGTFTPLMTCNTRYDEWAREFGQYVKSNDLPAVELVRFGNDHSANPMFNSFTERPDFAPYDVIKPPESILTQVNSANAPLARQIAKQSFSEEDQANMQLLNEAVWESVKGAGSPMPTPQHNVIDPAAYTGEG